MESPAKSTHNADNTVHVENNGTIYKQSYIEAKHVFAIPLSKLRTLTSGHLMPFMNRLTQKGCETLLTKINLPTVPTPWISTSELQEALSPKSLAPNTTNVDKKQVTQSSSKIRRLIDTLRVLALRENSLDYEATRQIDEIIDVLSAASLDESEVAELGTLIDNLGSIALEV
jgi:hypothetical protein